MRNKKNFKIGLLLALFLLLIAGGIFVYGQSKTDPTEGTKKITVEVVMDENTSTTYAISTDEEYLRGALEQENLVEGSESELGLFVITVDNYTVNDANQEWWAFSKDGQPLMTGVDETPIEDGDYYKITLTVGY